MTKPKQKTENDFGPNKFSRDEHGLIKNTNYIFNEDGSIDWRAMVKEEHLFPNKLWFERFNKPLPKTIEGLKDHQLLIKLSGIKELARLRGFSSCEYTTHKCDPDHVAISCKISFIPNYETNGLPIVFEDMANATVNNTSSFAKKFLETIACNRSFVRCVRNFLNIHIVGMDEMDTSDNNAESESSKSSNNSFSAQSVLEKYVKENLNCKNFECFKDFLLSLKESGKYFNKDVEEWQSFDSIPSKEARILLGIIKSN